MVALGDGIFSVWKFHFADVAVLFSPEEDRPRPPPPLPRPDFHFVLVILTASDLREAKVVDLGDPTFCNHWLVRGPDGRVVFVVSSSFKAQKTVFRTFDTGLPFVQYHPVEKLQDCYEGFSDVLQRPFPSTQKFWAGFVAQDANSDMFLFHRPPFEASPKLQDQLLVWPDCKPLLV
jgi:hypothetical protein